VGGQPLRDKAMLQWAGEVIDSVLLASVSTAAAVAAR
jgi:hypothetical protein